jgi:hypothetical protein
MMSRLRVQINSEVLMSSVHALNWLSVFTVIFGNVEVYSIIVGFPVLDELR